MLILPLLPALRTPVSPVVRVGRVRRALLAAACAFVVGCWASATTAAQPDTPSAAPDAEAPNAEVPADAAPPSEAPPSDGTNEATPDAAEPGAHAAPETSEATPKPAAQPSAGAGAPARNDRQPDPASEAEPARRPSEPEPSESTPAPEPGKRDTTESPPKRELLLNRYTSAAIVGGTAVGLYTWTYFAWYKERATADHIIWNTEGWFGPDTYAAGADKLGHFWVNYAMNRLISHVLEEGGWTPLQSTLIATGGTMGFFTFIEIKDGLHPHYGFSWIDMAFNAGGNLAALGMIMVPEIDRMFDLKVAYIPSKIYRRRLAERGAVNAGEDYTGQIYQLTYHLGSLPSLRHASPWHPLRFVDVAFGYRARNYLPEPPPETHRYQEYMLCLGLDMQHVFDLLWDRYENPRTHAHGAARFFQEVLAIPYTTLPTVTYRQDNGPHPPDDDPGH